MTCNVFGGTLNLNQPPADVIDNFGMLCAADLKLWSCPCFFSSFRLVSSLRVEWRALAPARPGLRA